MNSSYPLVASRAGHRCEYCRAPEAIFNFPFEVEHIIPLSLGGLNDPDNLALACRSCNLFKSVNIDFADPLTGESLRLFHPRRDLFYEHFAWQLQSGQLLALTPVGRATIACLRINSPAQLAARLQWLRLGLIP